MRKITPPPSIERLKEVLDYNPLTGIFIWKNCREPHLNGKQAGKVNRWGYRDIRFDGVRYRAHRLAWFWMTGAWPPRLDHEKGNRDDNRFAKLREASPSQNCYNRRRSATYNTSGHKGVCWHKHSGKWTVRIHVDRKAIFLGLHKKFDVAVAVYAAAAKKYHGEFARIE